jgi:glucan phosphoethanolaminetransferase (alkaline phosphatase superfamily)
MNFKFTLHLLFSFLLLLLLFVVIQSLMHPLFLWEETIYHFETFDLRGLAKGSLFLGSYFLAILSLFLLIFINSKRVFWVFLWFIFIFLSIDFFTQFLGISHGFSQAEYELSLKEMGNYKYLWAYMDTILKAMGVALVVSLLLYLIREKFLQIRVEKKYLFTLFLTLGTIWGLCYKIDTFKISSYPATVKMPLIVAEHIRHASPMVKRLLDKEIKPIEREKFKNIIWIIDESVTGTYLSINGYEKETTPFLTALDKESNKISNFGVVNSVSNCSSQSNLFLRIGVNPKKVTTVEEVMYTLPTIFGYAKRAGYKTWLFDSQTRKDYLQNYLTPYDKEDIDHFETLGPEVTRVDRDLKFLDDVGAIVNQKKSEDKNFIVLVKYGAHFPYLLTYKPENTRFKPVLGVSYGGMDMAHKEEQINTYANSIYSNVDLYLKKMVSEFDLSQSILFYTSDHGQNILEVEGLTRTHCNDEQVVTNEVSVPFMVFSDNAKELLPSDRNRYYSQIQMFPTTLSLFGYGKGVVEQYGKTLSEGFSSSEERAYILSSSFKSKPYK